MFCFIQNLAYTTYPATIDYESYVKLNRSSRVFYSCANQTKLKVLCLTGTKNDLPTLAICAHFEKTWSSNKF